MQLRMHDGEGTPSVFIGGAIGDSDGAGVGEYPAGTMQQEEKEEQECGKHDEVSGKS